jgi:hypothetical protein
MPHLNFAVRRTASTTLLALALAATFATSGCADPSQPDRGPAAQQAQEAPEAPGSDSAATVPSAPAPNQLDALAETSLLEVTVEGETELREAQLFVSPQGYAIYVLPQIVMTPEEPYRDQAFARIDGEFFVRIERLPIDASVEALSDNARFTLRDIGRVHSLEGEEIFDPLFRGAEFFLHASSPQVSVNILVIDIDGSRFRFMMHIPNREAAEGLMPSFWAMLRSIRTVGPLPAD